MKRAALQNEARSKTSSPALPSPSQWRHHELDLRSPQRQRAASLVADTVRGSGEPLGADARTEMESRFGHDFSRIRVHTGELAARSADAVAAQAYTLGHSVVLNRNMYAPDTVAGRQLLAHELTHVVQQEHAPGTQLPMVVQRMPIDDPESLPQANTSDGSSEPEGMGLPGSESSDDMVELAGGRTCGGSVGIPAAHHVTNFISRGFNTTNQCLSVGVTIRAGWFSDFPTSEIGGNYMVTIDDPSPSANANGTTRIWFQGGDGRVLRDHHVFHTRTAGRHVLRIFSDQESTLFLDVEGGSVTPQR
ncbi:MAG TPA: DUF4157 domain-containing protein [Thermoanaerobaculia bacterium]|jgi:hypothetical protein